MPVITNLFPDFNDESNTLLGMGLLTFDGIKIRSC